jgi:hypothetical protein
VELPSAGRAVDTTRVGADPIVCFTVSVVLTCAFVAVAVASFTVLFAAAVTFAVVPVTVALASVTLSVTAGTAGDSILTGVTGGGDIGGTSVGACTGTAADVTVATAGCVAVETAAVAASPGAPACAASANAAADVKVHRSTPTRDVLRRSISSLFPAFSLELTLFQFVKVAISSEATPVSATKGRKVTAVRRGETLKSHPGKPITRMGVPSVVSLYVSTL